MSDRPKPSPALLAANEKLLALRAAYRARKAQARDPEPGTQPGDGGTAGDGGETAVAPGAANADGHDAGPPWAQAAAPAPDTAADDAPALPAVLAALPEHLGWGSTAVADHIRGHVRERQLSMANPAAGSGQAGQLPSLRQAQDRFVSGMEVGGDGEYGAAGDGEASDTAVSDGGDEAAHTAVSPTGDNDNGSAETAVSQCPSAPTPQPPADDQPSQKTTSHPANDDPKKDQSSIQNGADRAHFANCKSSISLHPDLALAFLRAEETTTARLWLLLRRLDGDGRGWLAKTAVQAALTEKDSATYLCTPRYLRRLLARGEGLFWRQGDDGRLWLRGQAKVARDLGLGRLRGRLVEIPAEILLAPIGDVRAHFYAAFHSGRGEEAAPVSRETLRDLSGASARTQQAYEARAGVASEPCVALGPAVASVDPQAAAWRYGRAGFTFIDHQGQHGAAGRAYYARRLPNRYRGPHARGKKPRRLNRQLAGLCLIGDAGNGQVDWNGRRRYWSDGAGATRAWLKDGGETAVYWPGRGGSDGVIVWLERPPLTV